MLNSLAFLKDPQPMLMKSLTVLQGGHLNFSFEGKVCLPLATELLRNRSNVATGWVCKRLYTAISTIITYE